MLTTLAVTLLIALLLAATVHARTPRRPPWLPRIWWAIGMCETGLNWRHHTRDYQGAFGFYRGSWDQFRLPGMPGDADLATPRQQLEVALRIYRRYGFSGWGCFTHGGYRVWLARA